MKFSIERYNCVSAAGLGVEAYWQGLIEGTDFGAQGVCRWKEISVGSALELLVKKLVEAYGSGDPPSGPYGVILASTKGCIEDFVWESKRTERDPLTPVLSLFLEKTQLKPKKSICVSNACASSHAALYVADRWLANAEVSKVLLLSVDQIGPFIEKGFRSLRALTPSRNRPFGADRDGLQLGEAATALWVSQSKQSQFFVEAVGLDAEGFAVTRPEPSGASLLRACLQLPQMDQLDFIIAHGTGTQENDKAEASVFSELFAPEDCPPITATKWSVGHTLGSSGFLDLIAACQVMKHSQLFGIGNTQSIDPKLCGNFLYGTNKRFGKFRSAMVTSLGFGGIHAAVRVACES